MRAARETRVERACTSCRNGSSMMPRAIADWFVMTTIAKPARLSSRSASAGPGKHREQLEAIEIAALLDERAVAIQKHRRPAHRRPSRFLVVQSDQRTAADIIGSHHHVIDSDIHAGGSRSRMQG